MNSLWSLTVLVALLSSCALAHICLLYPEQRGGADISEPGSPSCFIPSAPCGKKPAETPKVTLYAGTTFNVLLQQNLNHYNPGWPGFIDVAWAVGTNQTEDSQFTVVAQIPDYWPHLQASQTNFSIPISVPNLSCPHCTLRVRYHPNKPEEPIFHNCADVEIVYSTAPQTDGKIIAAARNGPRNQAYTSQGLVSIDQSTGTLLPLPSSPSLLVRSAPSSSSSSSSSSASLRSQSAESLTQGLTASYGGKMYYVGGTDKESLSNRAPSTLFGLDPTTGTVLSAVSIQAPPALRQWTSLTATPSLPSAFIVTGIFPQNGDYVFQPFFLFLNGSTFPAAPSSLVQDTFVNVFWADFSSCANQFYLLSGDENSLETLDVMLFVFDLGQNKTTQVMVDNSKYTVTTMQVVGCGLYSVSPGLLNQTAQWSVVTISPSGAVAPVFSFGAPGFYTHYYGGGVYGQIPSTSSPSFYHIFQRANDLSFQLGLISLSSSSFYPTDLNLQLNSFVSLSAVTYIQ